MLILAIPGSLGSQSSNRILLEILQARPPNTIAIEIFDGISELPYFNPDLDRDGAEPPSAVTKFRTQLAKADALLIATPEYAHGIPGVLKNALDWLVSSPAMIDKPVGLIFGSAGDATFAQASLIEILRTMSARVVPGAILNISGIQGKLDKHTRVVDSQVTTQLCSVIEALSKAVPAGQEHL